MWLSAAPENAASNELMTNLNAGGLYIIVVSREKQAEGKESKGRR
jgi:hypothetical protein